MLCFVPVLHWCVWYVCCYVGRKALFFFFFFFLGGGRFITINRQRIIQIMYIRAEMKDIRNIH